MHRLLVAVDGSQQAERAVRYLIGLIREGGLLGGEREVHLINVQPQPSPKLTRSIPLTNWIATIWGKVTRPAARQRSCFVRRACRSSTMIERALPLR